MHPSARLYVAMVDDGDSYRHWALAMDAPRKNWKIFIYITGSVSKFRFKQVILDASSIDPRVELVELCRVCASNAREIIDMANKSKDEMIRNDLVSWNSQEYALDLLWKIQDEGLLDRGKPFDQKRLNYIFTQRGN